MREWLWDGAVFCCEMLQRDAASPRYDGEGVVALRQPKLRFGLALCEWPPQAAQYSPLEQTECLRRDILLVLAVLDEIVDHGGIGQRRRVAEAAGLILRDLAQDAAHDFAGAGLRQSRRELDLVQRRDRQ